MNKYRISPMLEIGKGRPKTGHVGVIYFYCLIRHWWNRLRLFLFQSIECFFLHSKLLKFKFFSPYLISVRGVRSRGAYAPPVSMLPP